MGGRAEERTVNKTLVQQLHTIFYLQSTKKCLSKTNKNCQNYPIRK